MWQIIHIKRLVNRLWIMTSEDNIRRILVGSIKLSSHPIFSIFYGMDHSVWYLFGNLLGKIDVTCWWMDHFSKEVLRDKISNFCKKNAERAQENRSIREYIVEIVSKVEINSYDFDRFT